MFVYLPLVVSWLLTVVRWQDVSSKTTHLPLMQTQSFRLKTSQEGGECDVMCDDDVRKVRVVRVINNRS